MVDISEFVVHYFVLSTLDCDDCACYYGVIKIVSIRLLIIVLGSQYLSLFLSLK